MKPTEEEIQALLRSARVDEPMPADVASRLDDVLAGLASAPAPVAPVIPLRRRMAPKLLTAAAAFALVAGVGIGLQQVLTQAANDSLSSGAGDGGAAEAESAPAPAAPRVTNQDGQSLSGTSQLADRLLERSRLDTDLRAAARELTSFDEARNGTTLDSGGAVPTPAPEAPASPFSAKAGESCPEPALAAQPGALSEVVLLDGAAALLVVGPGKEGRHVVELWSCGTQDALVAREALTLE